MSAKEGFSKEVRNQLALIPVERACCRHAQLLALTIISASEAASVEGQPHLVFRVDNLAVARHLFRLGKAIFGLSPRLDIRPEAAEGRTVYHRVALPVGPNGMLPATLTLDELRHAIERKACCRRSFLRAAFMGAGSLVSPRKAYHLEFNGPEGAVAWVAELLVQEGVHPRLYQRPAGHGTWTCYVKDSLEIAHFLAMVGAQAAWGEFEEVRQGKDLVNSVQRVVNCETANLNRTLSSAERQVWAIQWLEGQGGLARLTPELQAMALLRLELPHVSLQALGEASDPPLTKSAVNHRLKQIMEAYHHGGGPDLGMGQGTGPLGSRGTAPLRAAPTGPLAPQEGGGPGTQVARR